MSITQETQTIIKEYPTLSVPGAASFLKEKLLFFSLLNTGLRTNFVIHACAMMKVPGTMKIPQRNMSSGLQRNLDEYHAPLA